MLFPQLQELAPAVLTAALTAWAATALAQTFVDTTQVVVVEVPVQVVREGEPVRGLTAADFELYDGRNKVDFTGFEVVDLAQADAGAVGRGDLPVSARRHFLVLFDMRFSDPKSILQARKAAQEMVDTLHPTDLVGSGPIRGSRAATGSRLHRRPAADRGGAGHPGRARVAGPAASGPPAPGDRRQQQRLRLHGKHRAPPGRGAAGGGGRRARRPAGHLPSGRRGAHRGAERRGPRPQPLHGRLRPHHGGHPGAQIRGLALGRVRSRASREGGRRARSRRRASRPPSTPARTGEYGDTESLERRRAHAGRAAARRLLRAGGGHRRPARPGDLGGRKLAGQEVLLNFAKGTGGELYEKTNDLGGAMQQMLRRTGVTYVLSFQPDEVGKPESFHRLQVEVKNQPRGTRVVHRPGWYAPKPYAARSPLEKVMSAASQLMGGEEGADPGFAAGGAVPRRRGAGLRAGPPGGGRTVATRRLGDRNRARRALRLRAGFPGSGRGGARLRGADGRFGRRQGRTGVEAERPQVLPGIWTSSRASTGCGCWCAARRPARRRCAACR